MLVVWHALRSLPAPGEPGPETWKDKNNAWQTGGGAMWVTGSYDAATNQILWGTGKRTIEAMVYDDVLLLVAIKPLSPNDPMRRQAVRDEFRTCNAGESEKWGPPALWRAARSPWAEPRATARRARTPRSSRASAGLLWTCASWTSTCTVNRVDLSVISDGSCSLDSSLQSSQKLLNRSGDASLASS
jgi:hypothetical protein